MELILFYSIILEKIIFIGPLWMNEVHLFDIGIKKYYKKRHCLATKKLKIKQYVLYKKKKLI